MEVQELAPLASSVDHAERLDLSSSPTLVEKNIHNNNYSEPSSSTKLTVAPPFWGYFLGYVDLLRNNRPFTLYLCSYITNHIGEWLTYLASLTALHRMLEKSYQGDDEGSETSSSGTAIGLLVSVRLLTNVLASPFGGVLADAMDRKRAMIILDLAGAVLAWLFVLAIQLESPALIFLATILQEVGSGLYEPSRSAIVPLLCPTEEELEKATLLTGMAWSTVAAAGSAAGGFLVTFFGMRGCFMADSVTYLLSALLMACIGNERNWSVVSSTDDNPNSNETSNKDASNNNSQLSVETLSEKQQLDSPLSSSSTKSTWTMLQEGWVYINSCPWGLLVFWKACSLWMTMDVLLVAYAERVPSQAPIRLGTLFAAVGVGCLIGPPFADQWTDLKRPWTVQIAAVVAFVITTLACAILAILPPAVPLSVLFVLQVMRSSGVAILWINSSLLLQKLSAPQYLGRVTSMEYGLALTSEAWSALVTGRLRDVAGWSPEQVCACLAAVGTVFSLIWAVYTWRGGGAMNYQNITDEKITLLDETDRTSSHNDDSDEDSDEDLEVVEIRPLRQEESGSEP